MLPFPKSLELLRIVVAISTWLSVTAVGSDDAVTRHVNGFNLAGIVHEIRPELRLYREPSVDEHGLNYLFGESPVWLLAVVVVCGNSSEAQQEFAERIRYMSAPRQGPLHEVGNASAKYRGRGDGGTIIFQRFNCVVTLGSNPGSWENLCQLALEIDRSLLRTSVFGDERDRTTDPKFRIVGFPPFVIQGSPSSFQILPASSNHFVASGISSETGGGDITLSNGHAIVSYKAPASLVENDTISIFLATAQGTLMKTNMLIAITSSNAAPGASNSKHSPSEK